MGLRETKKAKTRKAISDMATLLFVERGYHQVTTTEIAQRAEVSVPTLFNYFPTKESLVFDEDAEVEQALVSAILERDKGQKILDALYDEAAARIFKFPESHRKHFHAFVRLVAETPELNLYSQRMWMRYEKSLAAAIRKEAKKKLSAVEAGAIARFVLDSFHRSLSASKPAATLRDLFDLLGRGWDE